MKNLKKILVIAAICFSNFCAAEVIVIVNSANNDVIDDQLIKNIYLGKSKAFPNGNKVKVYSLKSSQEDTEYFRSKALKKSNSQFKSYWSKLAFTGKGKPATELGSAAELIDAIKNDPNAIGFINSNDVSSEVKTLVSY
ncbi:MAG: ABC-type phosphate transport system substrate-binding protein [Alteromonadaceae bacterium]|jgi:ABC-type phosphate transport system substrate-binding protein